MLPNPPGLAATRSFGLQQYLREPRRRRRVERTSGRPGGDGPRSVAGPVQAEFDQPGAQLGQVPELHDVIGSERAEVPPVTAEE